MNPFILLALGLILIFLEFYLPGAIMGTIGGLLVVTSIIVFAVQGGSPIEIILFVIGASVAVGFLIKFALWRIPRTKSQYSIYSDKDQEGYLASEFDSTAIGKTGIVSSDLKPGGYIIIEGKQQAANSQSGYLVKGTEVVVIGGEGDSLIVKLKKDKGGAL